MFVYDNHGRLKCPNCGSREFDMVAEMRVKDVTKDEEDPAADYSIESQNIISLVCARCGARIK